MARFFFHDESSFAELALWAENIDFNEVWKGGKDKTGNPMIGLSYRHDVSSEDFERRGVVIVHHHEFVDDVFALLRLKAVRQLGSGDVFVETPYIPRTRLVDLKGYTLSVSRDGWALFDGSSPPMMCGAELGDVALRVDVMGITICNSMERKYVSGNPRSE